MILSHIPNGPQLTVPVSPSDGVQYVTCGKRPSSIKYHITVDAQGMVTKAEPKRESQSSWMAGVDNEDSAAVRRRELLYGVMGDGASAGAADHRSVLKKLKYAAQDLLHG